MKATLFMPAAACLALVACGANEQVTSSPIASDSAGSSHTANVVVITHDSFAIPEDVVADFEASSGYTVDFVPMGDAGLVVNQLILTKDAPLGDVVFGVDNAFASRAIAEGVFSPFESVAAAAADADALEEGVDQDLTAIDFSDVCVNADLTYFAVHPELPMPTSLDDLALPEYASLLSIPAATTSSPGLAFLLATIAAMPDSWQDYWTELRNGGARTTASWSDSYYVDFSAPNYGGAYPLVVSYASSPPSEVIDGIPTTVSLPDTCFRQVEYAGILQGASNPKGAEAVIAWMLSDAFQSALPTSMYVYPVSKTAVIPDDWKALAPLSAQPWSLPAADISKGRDEWISEWSRIMQG